MKRSVTKVEAVKAKDNVIKIKYKCPKCGNSFIDNSASNVIELKNIICAVDRQAMYRTIE